MGIRQLIPASSRSFWQLYGEVEELRTNIETIQSKLDSLQSALNTHDSQMKMMAWEGIRNEGESLEEAKRRFFYNMPPATGGLRLFQLGNAKLLEEFDILCAENNLPYWIAFGTLLGAVRHGGFIPWDNDADLCMMRSDIDRLIDLVAESDRVRVTIVYDYWAFCKQIRFRYKDEAIPCFLDIFIFDYTTEATPELFDIMNTLRGKMIEEAQQSPCLSFWSKDRPLIDFYSNESKPIQDFFAQSYADLSRIMPELTDKAEDAKGVLWGMDNVYDFNNYEWCCSTEDIFPLQRLVIENTNCNAPANYLKFLEEVYGDYMSLPLVSNTYDHVSADLLQDKKTQSTIEGIL